MTHCSESRKEAAGPRKPWKTETCGRSKLLSHKNSLRIGCWNVRTMSEAGRCDQVAREMNRYGLRILALSETRWAGFGELELNSGVTLLYSGKDEDEAKEVGVAKMISREAKRSLTKWEPKSERILTARFHSQFQKVSYRNY